MRESKFFFSGDQTPITRTPLGVYIGKSRVIYCEMHIEPLNYKKQNANASVNIYMSYPLDTPRKKTMNIHFLKVFRKDTAAVYNKIIYEEHFKIFSH